MHHKVWDENYLYILKLQPLEFGNELISSHMLLGMWLHIHAGIKIKPC